MKKVLLIASAATCLVSCDALKSLGAAPPAPSVPAATRKPVVEKSEVLDAIRESEMRAVERESREPACDRAVSIFSGSVFVEGTGYTTRELSGDDLVEQPLEGLDKVVSKAKAVRFTLDYPFEKPFAGQVEGPITVRKLIDAIRAGFRSMYEGAVEKEIPGMYNKDVSGAYGRSFHAIGDLVIERIELCADDSLRISIGS